MLGAFLRRTICLLTLPVFLSFSACTAKPDQAPAISIGASPAPTSGSSYDEMIAWYAEAMRKRPEQEQLVFAFRAAFGADGFAEFGSGYEVYEYRPVALHWMGNTAILLAEGARPNACHSCPGKLSISYLSPRYESFAIATTWYDLVAGGEFGSPPRWTIRDDLSSLPVIETQGHYIGQGYLTTHAELVELRSDAPRVVAQLLLGCSNEGAAEYDEDVRTAMGTIVPAARNRSFLVRYEGTDAREIRYQRAGEVYQKAEGSPPDPDCIPAYVEPDPRIPGWAKALQALPEERQLHLAYQAVYGANGGIVRVENSTYTFSPVALLWLEDAWTNATAVLISTANITPACQSCSGRLDVHQLDPGEDGFSVQRVRPPADHPLVQSGTWGDPPDWLLRHDLSGWPVLQVTSSVSGNGYYMAHTELFELRAFQAPVSMAPRMILACDNMGAAATRGGGVRAVLGEIVPRVKDNSFAVIYSGTENIEVTYTRRMFGDYKPAGSVSGPKCM